MRQTGRSALAKWAARGKQYLTLMRPIEGGLVMQVLHYADEVRPFSEVPVGDAVVKDAELKLAMQLIDQISADEFHPEHYADEVRTRYQEASSEGRRAGDHRHHGRGAQGPDHRPHGGAQGQPRRQGRQAGRRGAARTAARLGGGGP